MEHDELKLIEEWLANEKEIAPLWEKLQPLLAKRHELEALQPNLVRLRGSRSIPGEPLPPASPPPPQGQQARQATLLLGSGEAIQGLPERRVPTLENFQKMAQKRAQQNKKKHEKEKAKKKAKKGPEPGTAPPGSNQPPRDPPGPSSQELLDQIVDL